mgnify:FL=1
MKKTIKEKIPIEQQKIENKLSFILDEAIPTNPTERKKYMSDCAFFYATVFKEKLKHFIGMQLEELSLIGRTEKGTDIIRAHISAFRLIDEWFKINTNEHLGNLEEIRNSLEEGEKLADKLKKIYGQN